jgi:hypothetical protein
MLNDAVTSATTHLHRVRSQKEALSASLAEQTVRQRSLKADLQRTSTSHQSAHAASVLKTNRLLDSSLDDLMSKLKDHFSLFNIQQKSDRAYFLFQDKDGFAERLRSEEEFAHRLTQYVKKQFRDSFVSLAASNDTSQVELVDVARASNDHRFQIDRDELIRLQSVDAPTTENLARARMRLAQRGAELSALQTLQRKCDAGAMEAIAILKYERTLPRVLPSAAA